MMSLARRPSPAAWLLVCVAAGALLGFVVPRPSWAVVVALLLGAAGARLVRAGFGWIAAISLGLAHGAMARAVDARSCRARFLAGPIELAVVLEEPSVAGQAVLATPIGQPCGGTVALRWRHPEPVWAGQVLMIQGVWIVRPNRWRADGTLAVDRFEARGQRPTAARRLRNWLGLTIDRLYGPRAGVIGALIVGTRGTIDPELVRAFARSGLVHLLSISGFHVGLVAGWIILLGRALRRPRLQAGLAAVVIVVAYVGFIGAPPPALRAAILATIGLVETWRQRAVGPGPLFAFTALVVVLFDPWALVDVGAWLSVTALWGATAATRWSDRAIASGSAWRIVAGSVGATAFTAPVAAFALGNVSLVGVGLNLIGIPLAAVAVPGVAATLVTAPVADGLARSLAAGSGVALGLLEALARGGARLPAAAIAVDPGPAAGLAALLVVGALIWVVGRRNTAREAGRRAAWIVAPIPLVMLAVGLAVRPHGGRRLTLHFLDVGQGDAALIETSHQHSILIDGGPAATQRDAGSRVVVPYLTRLGVTRLDLAIVSHAHLDHYGGSAAVFRSIQADLVAEPGEAVPDAGYIGWLDQVDRDGLEWRSLRTGARFVIDGVQFDVLHPDSAWAGWGEDLNDDSVVLRVRSGAFEAWFPGDAGFKVEETLAGRIGRIDLLKVGHHGSRTATSATFLAEALPKVAVVSTGPNRYGHPSPEALGRLATARVDVWRTDQDGTVTVEVFDSTMRVSGRKGVRTYPLN